MKTIKNIIFDFGVVLINLDYNLTINAFNALGIDTFGEKFSYAGQQELFDNFEIGLISTKEFYESIRSLVEKNLSDQDIEEAWNAILLDVPIEKIELLRKLKSKYRLFLLSNTNQIHVEAFTAYLAKKHGFDFFEELFEKTYFSNVVGMRKPDVRFYELVLKENNLKPEETIFIDDLKKNTDAAAQVGINTIHLTTEKDLFAELSEFLS